MNNPETKEFFNHYRKNLKETISETFPSIDPSYLDNLPTFNDGFVDDIKNQIAGAGFKLRSSNEVKRGLSIADKLFTYENPARTEWVGNFLPNARFEIIKKSLVKTGEELENLEKIERHTHYLVFTSV